MLSHGGGLPAAGATRAPQNDVGGTGAAARDGAAVELSMPIFLRTISNLPSRAERRGTLNSGSFGPSVCTRYDVASVVAPPRTITSEDRRTKAGDGGLAGLARCCWGGGRAHMHFPESAAPRPVVMLTAS